MEFVRDLRPPDISLHLPRHIHICLKELVDDDLGGDSCKHLSWCRTENPHGQTFWIGLNSMFIQHLMKEDNIWIWDFEILGSHKGGVILAVDVAKHAKICLRPRLQSSPVILEAFAGNGGWAMGVKQLVDETIPIYHVEIDYQVALNCGKTHGLPVQSIEKIFDDFLNEGKLPPPMVIHADIQDPRLCMLASFLQISHFLSSPPCQPWSGVGLQTGLACRDGRAWAYLFRFAFDIGVEALVCESVVGFKKHPHAKSLIELAKMCGYQVAVANVFPINNALPLNRTRWLGIFVTRIQDKRIPNHLRLLVQNMQFPKCDLENGMKGRHACIPSAAREHHLLLKPTQQELNFMVDPHYLPPWWRHGYDISTPEKILGLRTLKLSDNLQAVTASYTKQHDLDDALLRKNGLCTVFIQCDNQPFVRYYHPAEAAACLGWPNWVVLPAAFDHAWKIVGNGLSTAHAMMGFIQMHMLLGEQSPFKNVPGIVEAFGIMNKNVINFKDFDIAIDDFMYFVPKNIDGHHTPVRIPSGRPDGPSNEVTCTRPDTPDEVEKSRKRDFDIAIGISPTVPFVVDDGGVPRKYDDAMKSTKKLKMTIPDDQTLMVYLCSAIVHKAFDEPINNPIPFVVSCMSRRWVSVGWISANPKVEDVLSEVLPHAKSEHFLTLQITNQDVRFDHIVMSDKAVVKFSPKEFQAWVHIGNHTKWMTPVEVTTNIGEVMAHLAFHLEVTPADLVMIWKGRNLHEKDYVLAFPDISFQAFWQPRIQSVPRCIFEDFAILDEGRISDDVNLIHSQHRVVAMHPIWMTVKTCMLPRDATVAGIIEMLFPDIMTNANPIGFANGLHIPASSKMAELTKLKRFEVDFQAKLPLPVCTIEIREVADQKAIEEYFEARGQGQRFVSRWVRSPFRTRPTEYKLPANMTLADCGSSFLANCEGTKTILCLSNGKTINPMTECQHTIHDATLTFRLCALPGGAKNDDVKKMLSEILQSKGVPETEVAARINTILAKVDPAECRLVLQSDDTWDKLKGLANKNKVRLITHAELKNFQKQNRTKAIEEKAPKIKVPQTKENLQSPYQSQLDLNTIKVDLSHFRCEGSHLPSLSISDFGIDKHGICVMSNQQAEKYATDNNMSVAGLAILAVGYPAIKGHTLLHVPANKLNGNAIVIPATLINCGEQKVEFVSQVKDIKLNEVKSSVLEFVIDKATTKDWNLTQSTLHHLGSLFPELRDGKELNTWSVKSFDENRKPCAHPKAAYTHGFMRITDDVLEAALSRSGKSGAFLTVKDENKKFDTRYATVPLSPCTIEDANAQASKCRFALGVVKLRQGFAIRCKRENLQETRQFLNPDSLYVMAGQISSEDKLWILTRLSVSTTHDALTQCLKTLGWNARAVRQTSSQSWIIAAPEDPPMRHVRINGQVATITPKDSAQPVNAEVVCNVTPALDDTMSDVSTTTSSAPTAPLSRIDELRKELHEHMDKRLEETKTHLYRVEQQIQQNEASMNDFKKCTENELYGIKVEQTNIANAMQSNSASMMSEMATMLRNMQKESEQSMMALHAHFDKVVAGKNPYEAENKCPRQI